MREIGTSPPRRGHFGAVATAVTTTALLLACTVQQVMIGVDYRIVTPEAGSCPALSWQFFVDAQRHVQGTLTRPGQLPFAALSGTLDADDSFRMTVTDQTTHQDASVTGRFSSGLSTIIISGNGAGADCDGKTFSLRLGGYFARQGGGGGGGG